jgi:hypothetical protein
MGCMVYCWIRLCKFQLAMWLTHIFPNLITQGFVSPCHKYNTVLSRNRTGHTLKVQHPGTRSPMVGIEAHLFGIILRRAAPRHSVLRAEGLELANSLIEGTAHQLCLIEWKKKHLKMGEIDVTFGFLDPTTAKTFADGTMT